MKILIVDDHQLVGEGLAALLDQRLETPTIRHATDGFEAVAIAQEFKPDLVVLDITMPGMSGLEATRQIVQGVGPHVAVIVLSPHADSEFVVEALRSGARGFLPKSSAADALITAIHRVVAGETYLCPTVTNDVVRRYVAGQDHDADGSTPSPRHTQLSPRERQTLQMLTGGMSVKEIAFKLELSDKTVHAFRANLMEKLEITSIAELTKYAIRHGLTPLD
ncbi:MAG: response regulator transcription factor [Planctomycetota bacterium]